MKEKIFREIIRLPSFLMQYKISSIKSQQMHTCFYLEVSNLRTYFLLNRLNYSYNLQPAPFSYYVIEAEELLLYFIYLKRIFVIHKGCATIENSLLKGRKLNAILIMNVSSFPTMGKAHFVLIFNVRRHSFLFCWAEKQRLK